MRLRKEDQEYGERLQADSIRAIRKTMVVISGNSYQHAPWKKQSNVPNQSRSNKEITPMQAIPSDSHSVTRKREGSVFEKMDSFLRPSTVVKVRQVKNLSTEMVHEARLEKVIVGLTLSKTKASRVPCVKQDCQAKTMAHAVQSDSLVDDDLS